MTKITLAKITANVILTFEKSPQNFYNGSALLPLVDLSDIEQCGMETDVIVQMLNDAPAHCPLDELVKISLQYNSTLSDTANRRIEEDSPEYNITAQNMAFLCRNNAKYYFQPDQRDDYEQAIVDRLGIASKTANFKAPSQASAG